VFCFAEREHAELSTKKPRLESRGYCTELTALSSTRGTKSPVPVAAKPLAANLATIISLIDRSC
jgi:hypothetical protein